MLGFISRRQETGFNLLSCVLEKSNLPAGGDSRGGGFELLPEGTWRGTPKWQLSKSKDGVRFFVSERK